AIELRRQDGSLVGAQVNISLLGGKTVAVLTFVGSEFVGGSLADGSYTLTVRADRGDDRRGREVGGDGDGGSGGGRVGACRRAGRGLGGRRGWGQPGPRAVPVGVPHERRRGRLPLVLPLRRGRRRGRPRQRPAQPPVRQGLNW